MPSLQSLREMRALNFHLFGGLSEEDFYSLPRSHSQPSSRGEVTGYVTYNLQTREITAHAARSRQENLETQKV